MASPKTVDSAVIFVFLEWILPLCSLMVVGVQSALDFHLDAIVVVGEAEAQAAVR